MAKKSISKLKEGKGKNYVRAIKMVKSPKTGAYAFIDEVITTEKADNFFQKK